MAYPDWQRQQVRLEQIKKNRLYFAFLFFNLTFVPRDSALRVLINHSLLIISLFWGAQFHCTLNWILLFMRPFHNVYLHVWRDAFIRSAGILGSSATLTLLGHLIYIIAWALRLRSGEGILGAHGRRYSTGISAGLLLSAGMDFDTGWGYSTGILGAANSYLSQPHSPL